MTSNGLKVRPRSGHEEAQRVSLSEAQRAAVEHSEGPLLINATAGSGKTRVITQRAAKLIERGVDPDSILLVTFTNKAASEMTSRLGNLVDFETAKRIHCGTFHGICVRLLKQFEGDAEREGRPRDFTIYDQSDAEAIVKAATSELGIDPKVVKPNDVHQRISRAKSDGKLPEDVTDGSFADDLRAIWRRYEIITLANKAFDFDDLVNVVMRAAEKDSPTARWLRNRWQYILVDEYQDTSAVQCRLTKQLASSGNLTVVGDVNQSLYSWRGATTENILKFATHHYPTSKVVDMNTNYRSSKRIVAVTNAFRSNGEANTPNALGESVQVRSFRDAAAEARFIVKDVQTRIALGTPPSECVVLYRNHVVSSLIEKELRERGLPYDIVGGRKFYELRVPRDCLAYLNLLCNPANNLALERIINTPARGIGDKVFDSLRMLARDRDMAMLAAIPSALACCSLTQAQQGGLMRFNFMYKHAQAMLQHGKPSDVARELLKQAKIEESLLNKAAALEVKGKHPEAEQTRRDAAYVEQIVAAVEAYEGRVKTATLSGFLDEVAMITARDDASGRRVLLSTIHGIKGLEADAVWVAAFEEGILPGVKMDSDVLEEQRVAFVALSRARKYLTLTYADVRACYGKMAAAGPSKFLDMLPVEASVWAERDQRLKAEKRRTTAIGGELE